MRPHIAPNQFSRASLVEWRAPHSRGAGGAYGPAKVGSDFGKRLGSAGEGFFADVSIAVAHDGALVPLGRSKSGVCSEE
jgi:hypothetical protein